MEESPISKFRQSLFRFSEPLFVKKNKRLPSLQCFAKFQGVVAGGLKAQGSRAADEISPPSTF